MDQEPGLAACLKQLLKHSPPAPLLQDDGPQFRILLDRLPSLQLSLLLHFDCLNKLKSIIKEQV